MRDGGPFVSPRGPPEAHVANVVRQLRLQGRRDLRFVVRLASRTQCSSKCFCAACLAWRSLDGAVQKLHGVALRLGRARPFRRTRHRRPRQRRSSPCPSAEYGCGRGRRPGQAWADGDGSLSRYLWCQTQGMAGMGDLKTALQRYLQAARDALVWKLDGLSKREHDCLAPRPATTSSECSNIASTWRPVISAQPSDGSSPTPNELVSEEALEQDPQADWYATAEETMDGLIDLARRVWVFADEGRSTHFRWTRRVSCRGGRQTGGRSRCNGSSSTSRMTLPATPGKLTSSANSSTQPSGASPRARTSLTDTTGRPTVAKLSGVAEPLPRGLTRLALDGDGRKLRDCTSHRRGGIPGQLGNDRAVQRQPAVALEDLAGDPLHGVQGDDRLGDVVRARRAVPAPCARRHRPTMVSPRRSTAGPRPSIGVRVTPGATALTLMPNCAPFGGRHLHQHGEGGLGRE